MDPFGILAAICCFDSLLKYLHGITVTSLFSACYKLTVTLMITLHSSLYFNITYIHVVS